MSKALGPQLLQLLPEEIRIDKRIREDMGDIDALAESIASLGQLQPILIRASDRALIAGERRIAACRKLGRRVFAVAGVTGNTTGQEQIQC